ncbi:MAG: DUF4118 domain-containing protein [Acidimicrobiales bacterium]|nr:DUF4118 domain-containing protein [Acidimicrobiales bacterium]
MERNDDHNSTVAHANPHAHRPPMTDDLFDGSHLLNGIVVTAAVGLALVLVPAPVAVPALALVAFACGRLGGRDGGLGSIATGSFLFGYAITEPHFVWEIENGRDEALLVVLLLASLLAGELGVRLRRRTRGAER